MAFCDLLRWEWDLAKEQVNIRRHGIGFGTAIKVFQDPLAATRSDPHKEERRLRTIGVIGNVTVLVVHTVPEYDEITATAVGRIISARKATAGERNAYETEAN